MTITFGWRHAAYQSDCTVGQGPQGRKDRSRRGSLAPTQTGLLLASAAPSDGIAQTCTDCAACAYAASSL